MNAISTSIGAIPFRILKSLAKEAKNRNGKVKNVSFSSCFVCLSIKS